jgi:hypothetical protein
MTTPPYDKRFARDVAKQVDRRRSRRKATLWTLLFGAVIAAATYLRCGSGFGLGGGQGPGEGGDEAPHRATSGLRCAIRVAPSGIAVDGKRMTREKAVAACKKIGGADVLVTGDARHGDGVAMVEALRAAGVKDIILTEAHAPGPGSSSRQ